MTPTADIDLMPRAGFGARLWDRKLQTDRLEYLDRDDVPAKKRAVVEALDLLGEKKGLHRCNAEQAAGFLAGIDSPRVLELGAAHGGLSRELLKLRPDASITVTDIEPSSVAGIAASDLGSDSRVTVRAMDATAIDAPDGAFDLVVFALSFHHLPPSLAAKVFAEGTRVGRTLLIIDLLRLPAPLLAPSYLFAAAVGWVRPVLHDGAISQLRAYGPKALRSLAAHADPSIAVELRARVQLPMPLQIVVARRDL
ncbi:class I SAM-dependent methyltransferase [Mycobacteroides chelonae]|jgi:SAM-dependent methyltransferase|uniref:Methyltransferase type 11 n=1 Tax=Mycobacteroides chelonae TaxID=1774 RepID=A0AB73LGZ4_MYCCH|nr:class I SAM-dependent methyltransferase [Mycobacteroides chelonae]MBF9325444.1 class I SAM-dependent methyltransferase [Mycobacteroides chelonae]MBF9419620.1 class I SAM-dependent methyltransferase [Mycobacteroides chelonae]MBF9438102.1 class I SAM-dependent methyltransferase [Mycobacteroides chelonae]MBV6359404.1 class I SAM-dependent methyltransferase [Mycobacteroides chelonae]MEC4835010.1 class I SAM-dependent methyltransferase [Mycobacteroides chelonae]